MHSPCISIGYISRSGTARPKPVFQSCTKLLSAAVCNCSHWLGPQALGPAHAIKVSDSIVVSSLIPSLIPLLSVFLILAILIGVEEYHVRALIFPFPYYKWNWAPLWKFVDHWDSPIEGEHAKVSDLFFLLVVNHFLSDLYHLFIYFIYGP